MVKGAPDYTKMTLLSGLDAEGNQKTVLLDSEGHLIAVMSGVVSVAGTATVTQEANDREIQGTDGLNLITLAVDSAGRLISIMKGDDAGTLRTIAVDSAGKLLSVMQGNDAGTLRTLKVDASGQMVTLIKGSLGESITVDAAGNLVAVIKGDHAGALKTVATDAGGRMLVTPQYNSSAPLQHSVLTDPTGPHAYTDQTDYTVPAGKNAVVYSVHLRIRIITAATTPGLRVMILFVGFGGADVPLAQAVLSTTQNAINDEELIQVSIGMPLPVGARVRIRTFDTSTGGTCEYSGAVAIMRYDL